MKMLLLCTLLFFYCASPGTALESEEERVSQEVDESAENFSESTVGSREDVHRVHSIVDKLLGDTEEVEERKKNISVTKQVKALRNNMKGLQKSLDDFVRTQEAGENKARKLYRKIHNAFSESFGDDIFKSPEELTKQKETKDEKTSAKKSKPKKKWKASGTKQQKVYTVKQKLSSWSYPVRSYNSRSSSYSYPVKVYGSRNGNIPHISSYPVKSYGTQYQTSVANTTKSHRTRETIAYTVKSSYGVPVNSANKAIFHPKNGQEKAKCCGR